MILKVLPLEILAVVFLIGDTSLVNGTPNPAPNLPDASMNPADYPTPKRDDSAQDTYCGTNVIKDPYRWFENAEDPDIQKFIHDEMAITIPYLEKFPYREELKNRFIEFSIYPIYNGINQYGSKYFGFRNTGLQHQDVLYVYDTPNPNDEGKVILDSNPLIEKGIYVDLSVFSNDGVSLAYLTSLKDSPDKENELLQFKEVETGEMYNDKVTNVTLSNIHWMKDHKGLFYESLRDQNHKLFYHLLGTDQSKDVMVAEFPENPPDYFISAVVSDCEKYLIMHPGPGMENLVYVADLEKINYEVKHELERIPIVTKMEASFQYVTNIETQFIFITNKDAENYKLVSVDITQPNSWKDLVPEHEKNVLNWAYSAWEYMVLCYTENVKSVLQLHEVATGKKVKNFDFGIGDVSEATFYARKPNKDMYFTVTSYVTPGIIYHCDLSKPPFDLDIFKEMKVKNFDRTKYTVEQLFYNSKDGTKIPMYCTYKNGLEKNGNNFVNLEAYGGFGESVKPRFSVNGIIIVDTLKGVFCEASIRGGGDYGEQWHKDGSLDKKQNSFDDFQAAAKFLIDEKFTNPKLLFVDGTENGGLIMAVSLEQAPELFGAVVLTKPFTDMLRYDKFPPDSDDVSEYGTATNNKDFEYLIKYSPLQNVKMNADTQYPATMINIPNYTDGALPFHSYKFIATLQHEAKKFPNQKNPFLLYVGPDTGNRVETLVNDYVNLMSFAILNTGIQFQLSQDKQI